VQTLHNFRHDCIAGTYFREGSPCTSCTGHALGLAAVQHGCYRGSRLQSVPMALGRTVHRRTWRQLDRYIVLTPFHRDLLVAQGVPADAIVVRPTYADDPGPATAPGRDVLFLGRLSQEKGVAVLLQAWEQARPEGRRLVVAGDGPLRPVVTAAAERDASVRYVGSLDGTRVADAIRSAGVVATPSLWFEGLPHVIVESLSHGRAVMLSSLGGTAAAVGPESGWAVAPDVESWAQALSALDDRAIASRGGAARARFEAEFDSARAMRRLLSVYDDVTLAGAA
jgi:glycosyltransferase involved in cell wall biosynthesis